MRISRYTYTIPFGDKTVFFNGIWERFYVVDNVNVSAFQEILAKPDEYLDEFGDFIARMKRQGFIVGSEDDELEHVKAKYEVLTRQQEYFMLILPTYQCNLRCWYCIQDHQSLYMDSETIHRVKRRIDRAVENPEIKMLTIAWFGGEPLIAYNTVLELTRYAQEQASKNNKVFSCSITTNGTLLNEKRIEELRMAGVTSYQITIDGDRVTHNSVKKLGAKSAYDTTISNINQLAKHTYCSLRFNYTKENLLPENIIGSLKSTLDACVKGKIKFTIFKVWQENSLDIDSAAVDTLFDSARDIGLYPVLSRTNLCYTDQKYYDCIFPNGRVGKCDNHLPADAPGVLQDDGSVIWEQDISEIHGVHIFDGKQEECRVCKYLPVCWGPCVVKRETMLQYGDNVTCQYKNRDEEMKNIVLNICKTKLQKTNQP